LKTNFLSLVKWWTVMHSAPRTGYELTHSVTKRNFVSIISLAFLSTSTMIC